MCVRVRERKRLRGGTKMVSSTVDNPAVSIQNYMDLFMIVDDIFFVFFFVLWKLSVSLVLMGIHISNAKGSPFHSSRTKRWRMAKVWFLFRFDNKIIIYCDLPHLFPEIFIEHFIILIALPPFQASDSVCFKDCR